MRSNPATVAVPREAGTPTFWSAFYVHFGTANWLNFVPLNCRSFGDGGFGDQPGLYHSDAIFLMDMDAAQAMPVFKPLEGVDKVWAGDGVIYSQRLSALRTKSRLSRIIGTPVYQSMTIRNWSTTTKLLEILKNADEAGAART